MIRAHEYNNMRRSAGENGASTRNAPVSTWAKIARIGKYGKDTQYTSASVSLTSTKIKIAETQEEYNRFNLQAVWVSICWVLARRLNPSNCYAPQSISLGNLLTPLLMPRRTEFSIPPSELVNGDVAKFKSLCPTECKSSEFDVAVCCIQNEDETNSGRHTLRKCSAAN